MRSIITDFVLFTFGSSTVLTILAKSTFLLAASLLVAAAARHVRASVRHLLFATTFALLLALPVVVFSGPVFFIEVPVENSSSPAGRSAANPLTNTEASLATASAQPGSVRAGETDNWSRPSVATALLGIWTIGMLMLAGSLMADLWRVRSLRRHGLPTGRLNEMTADLVWESGGRRRVEVLLHEGISAPFTCGWLRPVIMLPASATAWSEAELRHALVHELEHIRRGDWPTQLAARAACAFYWFHPLVWMAWRKLCLEAERACDDAVIENAETTQYAAQLVDLSQQMSAGRPELTLGMAKRSDLARRVAALLDTTQRRGRVGILTAACSILVGAFVLVSIGPLRAVAQSRTTVDLKIESKTLNTSSDDDNAEDDEPSSGSPNNRALFTAAAKGDVERILSLLEKGANPNARFDGDGSPLIAAARNGRLEAVNTLLDHDADPNLGIPGDGTPLIVAAQYGHLDVVITLLERGANIDLGIPGDANPLIAAAGAGHADIVAFLLDRGADIHHVEPGDENAIIHASESGRLNVVKLLLDRGADINSRVVVERGDGRSNRTEVRTPLNMARRGGHTDVVNYLLSRGAREQ